MKPGTLCCLTFFFLGVLCLGVPTAPAPGAPGARPRAVAPVPPDAGRGVLDHALAAARARKDRVAEAAALLDLAGHCGVLQQLREVVEFGAQAELLLRGPRDRGRRASCLNLMGSAHRDLGEKEEALTCYERALAVATEAGSAAGRGEALLGIVQVYRDQSEPDAAFARAQEAVVAMRAAKDAAREAKALRVLGELHRDTGRKPEALALYEQARQRAVAAGHRQEEIEIAACIAQVHRDLGDSPAALRVIEGALGLAQNDSDRLRALRMLAQVQRDVGATKAALATYERVLALQRQAGDRLGEIDTLSQQVHAYQDLSRPDEALASLEAALKLSRGIAGPTAGARILGMMGEVQARMGRADEARKSYEASLSLARQTRDGWGEAEALLKLAALTRTGHPQDAMDYLAQAKEVRQKLGDREGEARALLAIGELAEAQGDRRAALRAMREGLTTLEQIRGSLGGLAEAKGTSFRANLFQYQKYIDLLLKEGIPLAAFRWSQTMKAGALVDLMVNGRVEIEQLLTPADRDRERLLQRRAADLQRQLTLARNDVKGDPAPIVRNLVAAETDLQLFRNDLYARHPELAAKRAADPIRIEDAAGFLPPDTLLLEYVVLDAQDGGGRHDRVVRYCLSTEWGEATYHRHDLETPASELAVLVERFRESCASRGVEYHAQGRDLYRRLFPPTKCDWLAGKKRVIICPDGPLWRLPFQALVVPGKEGEAERFLVENHEIVYAYSATAARAALQAGARQRQRPGRPTILALAAPTTPPHWPALPGAQQEAGAIRRHFPGAQVLTGGDASEARAKREMSGYRYLHLAAHAQVNDATPLASEIILAAGPGDGEDGQLTARELFSLDLAAEMVVLSGCDTAKGQVRRGEGVVGLSWALFAAGVPTQVVSQWSADDQATALLMNHFYDGLARGWSKGDALRGATLAVMKDARFGHPRFWAPFVLMGDWR